MTTIFVGDTGTELLFDCGVDISTAIEVSVIAKPPVGNTHTWVASVVNTNFVRYVLQAGDIPKAGKWAFQVHVVMPEWNGRGEWAIVDVKN